MYHCRITAQANCGKKEFKVLLEEVVKKHKELKKPCFIDEENDLIVMGKPLEKKDLTNPLIVEIKCDKIGKSKNAVFFSKMLTNIIRDYYSDKSFFAGRGLIFKGKIIESLIIKNLKISLERHESVRFSPYIAPDFSKYAVMIYPSYKLSLTPTLDLFIKAGIDISNDFARSFKPWYYSGKIKTIMVNNEENKRLYRSNVKEIVERHKDENITPKEDIPIISLQVRSEKRDIWEFSNLYRLQVRFDFIKSNQFFTWELNKLQQKIEFTPEEFVKVVDGYKADIHKIISEWGIK